jgi:enamine deaminase RidA (YjgF/YER057c/UK114 family)
VSIAGRLAELGIALPPPPKPVASYLPAVRSGSLLFISGQLPTENGRVLFPGKVPADLSIEDATAAARVAVLNALAVAQAELGSLDRVAWVVRLTGHVASAPGFTAQPAVINGASDLLFQVFGERGRHSRAALGAAELPLGAPVEIELILEIEG